MTKQGAKKRLNACVVHNFQCSSCEYEYDCDIAQVHDIAIECIEKQIPKEAKCHVSGNGWYGWIEFTCPVCGKEFKDSLVCPCCYQRVKPYKESDNE